MYPLTQNDIDAIYAKAGFAEEVVVKRILLEELLRNYKPSHDRMREAIGELREKVATLENQLKGKDYDT